MYISRTFDHCEVGIFFLEFGQQTCDPSGIGIFTRGFRQQTSDACGVDRFWKNDSDSPWRGEMLLPETKIPSPHPAGVECL